MSAKTTFNTQLIPNGTLKHNDVDLFNQQQDEKVRLRLGSTSVESIALQTM